MTTINVFSCFAPDLLLRVSKIQPFFVSNSTAGTILGFSGVFGTFASVISIKAFSRKNTFMIGHLI